MKLETHADFTEEPSGRADLKIRVTEVPAEVPTERAYVRIKVINNAGEVISKDALDQ